MLLGRASLSKGGAVLREYWPVALAVVPVFVAWGDMRRSVRSLREDMDKKVSTETFAQVDKRLERIESNVDRLVDTLLERN